MKNFFRQSYYTYRGLFMWLNLPGYISSMILYPIANVMMYSLIGRFAGSTDTAAFAIGIVIFSMSFSSINGLAQSYSYELSFGTLPFFYVSRANRLKNYLARGLLHYPNALIAFILGLATSCLAANISLSGVSWVPLILSVLAIAFSLISLGQLLGLISIITRNWIAVQGMALGLLMVFCGAIIPTGVFPGFITAITRAIPITNGLLAARAAFGGASLDATGVNILYELIAGLGYCIISYTAFNVFEAYAKRTGKLERDAH